MTRDPNWTGAVSLEQRVMRLIRDKKTDSQEFQTYLRFYGRERMEAIWRDYKAHPERCTVDETPHPIVPTRHQPEKKKTYPKAESFVARSNPDDVL